METYLMSWNFLPPKWEKSGMHKPYVLEMPYLKNEIDTLFGLRSEVIF